MGAQIQNQVDEKQFTRMEAIINSMTPVERRDPDVINGSRKKRIAAGSGTEVQEVNKVLKQHKQMSKMMKKVGKKVGCKKCCVGSQESRLLAVCRGCKLNVKPLSLRAFDFRLWTEQNRI